MTAEDYERETESMLDVLILYPKDLIELVAYVSEEDAAMRECQSADAPAIFKEER